MAQVRTLTARVAELEARLGRKGGALDAAFRRAMPSLDAEVDGHRPAIWVSDLYSAQQGHGADWQICLAHPLRDCPFAIEAGDAIFAPRMKALLLRAFALARRRHQLAASTRRQ